MSGYVPRHNRQKKAPEEKSRETSESKLLNEESEKNGLPSTESLNAETSQSGASRARLLKTARMPRQAQKNQESFADSHPQESARTAAQWVDTADSEPENNDSFIRTSSLDTVISKEPAPNASFQNTAPLQELSAKASSSDDTLLSAISDADFAVREHPELADPLAAIDESHSKEVDPALAKIRRRRWPITIAIILVIIIASGAITYYVLSSQALEREANRTAGYELLDEAIALIQESDQVVVSFDSATTTEVTEANIPEREVLLERVPTTLETLNVAEEKATDAVDFLTSADDKEFAQHVIDAAANRKVMLTSGETIISKDIQAMTSALIFAQAWELIVNADTELRATTELSRTGSYNELHEAIERNGVILTNLQQASDLLSQAQEAFVEADFSSVAEYIVLKRESVQLAIEADQAILNGDIDTVHAKNEEFGLKDAAVVEAVSNIPTEPLTMITKAYETATSEEHALYNSARGNAADADGYIREYVGVETKTG